MKIERTILEGGCILFQLPMRLPKPDDKGWRAMSDHERAIAREIAQHCPELVARSGFVRQMLKLADDPAGEISRRQSEVLIKIWRENVVTGSGAA